jgi:hypothetical protein
MSSDLVIIIDQALKYALLGFLLSYLILLLYSRAKLRGQRKKLEDIYMEVAEGVPSLRSDRLPFSGALFDQWRISLKALMVSLLCGLAIFIIFLFTPLPLVKNFASDNPFRIEPLRVTALTYDRFYEGFSVKGEVWNQTEDPFDQLQAVIRVIGTDGQPLEEVSIPVEPAPLEPGAVGLFELNYTQNSPFISGYQVSFHEETGRAIPHVLGFDVD